MSQRLSTQYSLGCTQERQQELSLAEGDARAAEAEARRLATGTAAEKRTLEREAVKANARERALAAREDAVRARAAQLDAAAAGVAEREAEADKREK
jgi:hypothetical protein